MELAESIMTKKLVTCTPSDTISNVQKLMIKHNISRVVIVDAKNKPVGIVTEEDIIDFLIEDKSKRGIEEIKTEEVMTKKLVTATPKTAMTDIAKTMGEKRISSIIIVDDKGKLEGLVTKTDVTVCCGTKKGLYKVQDFMTPKPVTVTLSQPIFLVASLMAEHKISRVIVVDKEKKPIGIITAADMTMVSKLLRPAKVMRERKPLLVRGLIALPKSVYLLTAGDIMTPDPASIARDSDLADAAKLMVKHGVSGLPVTEKEKLVGIITKSDIVRAVASKE
jgi:CBS domain-containing protein